ncbi:MAG: dihydrofolate synthase [Arthrobacter sp.]|nr:dihydrofolate synthase [Arthrobacter sp.]
MERAEANEDLAGGVLVTGSITLVADARILLGKAAA